MPTLFVRDCAAILSPVEHNGRPAIETREGASIFIEDGVIAGVGSAEELLGQFPRIESVKTFDGRGKIVLPGLIDPHTHLPFVGWREGEFNRRLHGETYMEIAAAGGGILSTVHSVRQAALGDLVEACRTYLDSFVRHGVTTVEAKSGYGLTLKDEIKQLTALNEINAEHDVTVIPTLLAAHEIPLEFRDRREEWIAIILDEIIPAVAEGKLARFQDVFCEEGVFTPEESAEILERGKAFGLIPRLHADEIKPSGGAATAARVGAVSADHLAFPSEKGIAMMAEKGVIATLLPGTSLFLRHATHAPARNLLDSGVKVALSTDFNPGSSPTTNLPLIMRLGCFLLGMTVEEVLHAVTLVAARTLLLDDRGLIEVGKRGDLSLWNARNLLDLFYRYGDDPLAATIIAGKVVYRAD